MQRWMVLFNLGVANLAPGSPNPPVGYNGGQIFTEGFNSEAYCITGEASINTSTY
jgi:hypothetical protein